MYVPLDHLYHWIHSFANRPATIYYLYPHGSKNLSQCIFYPPYKKQCEDRKNGDKISVLCHDQEPLNFDFYQRVNYDDLIQTFGVVRESPWWLSFDRTLTNLDMLPTLFCLSIYDKCVLIHSERNSIDVEHYLHAGYEPVHYWCHGVIARDWFRFAQLDLRLKDHSIVSKDFLIYSRDWSGSREYRLKFLEMIQTNYLNENCLVYFKALSDSSNIHYRNHIFENKKFDLIHKDLDDEFMPSMVGSEASADYCVNDHVNTKISVILETQFDGSKIHLTEKICRALACGHPFILAAGPGSLKYLKSYGFETFESWIDESYDQESDSLERLQKIIVSMKKFANLDQHKKLSVYQELKHIAERNQKRFFSDDFAQQLTSELRTNFELALENATITQGTKFRRRLKLIQNAFGKQYRNNNTHFLKNLKLLRTLRHQKLSF